MSSGATTGGSGGYTPISNPAMDAVSDAEKAAAKKRQDEAQARREEQRREKRADARNQTEVVEAIPEPYVDDSLTNEQEIADSASEEAKRKARQLRTKTQTVLTSPLGATTQAKTAVAMLGGA